MTRIEVQVVVDTAELREWAAKHAASGRAGVAHVLYEAADRYEQRPADPADPAEDPALPLGTLVEVRGSATAPDGIRGPVRSLPNADGIVLVDHVDGGTRYGVHVRNLTPVPAAVPADGEYLVPRAEVVEQLARSLAQLVHGRARAWGHLSGTVRDNLLVQAAACLSMIEGFRR